MAIEIYRRQVGPAVPQVPGGPRLQDAPLAAAVGKKNAPDTGLDEFLTGALRLGRQQLNLVRMRDVAAASNEFHSRLGEFKSEYMQNKKGKDALTAETDFQNYAEGLMDEIQARDNYDYATRSYIARYTAPAAISFVDAGRAYGRQQRDAYDKTLQDGAIATLNQFVAENAGNDNLIAAQVAATKEQLMAMNPGMDMTATNAKIDQSVVGNRIGTYLANGDIGSARNLFHRDMRLLGDKADEYASRIRSAELQAINMAYTQERRAELRAQKQSRLAKNEIGRQIIDLLRSGDSEGAEQLLENHKGLFDYGEYGNIRDSLDPQHAATKDDLGALNDIYTAQLNGQDANELAQSAYLNGQITKSTFEDLVSNPLKQADADAVAMLSAATGGDNPDPNAGKSRGMMLSEYRSWVEQNPKATASERREAAQKIVDRYSFYDTNNNLATADLPAGLTRYEVVHAKDLSKIDEVGKKLVEDFKAGRITKEEADKQAERIQKIRNLVQVKLTMQTSSKEVN